MSYNFLFDLLPYDISEDKSTWTEDTWTKNWSRIGMCMGLGICDCVLFI